MIVGSILMWQTFLLLCQIVFHYFIETGYLAKISKLIAIIWQDFSTINFAKYSSAILHNFLHLKGSARQNLRGMLLYIIQKLSLKGLSHEK